MNSVKHEKTTFVLVEAAMDLILYSGIRRAMVYGVRALNSQGEELVCMPALCTDRMIAECFVNLCNAQDVDPIHAYDVVRDFALSFAF